MLFGRTFKPSLRLAPVWFNSSSPACCGQSNQLLRQYLVLNITNLTSRSWLHCLNTFERQHTLLLPLSPQWVQLSKRFMAKGKDRKKEKKHDRPKVMLTDDEMEQVMHFDDFKLEVEGLIDDMKNDLKNNFNLRLNQRQIENLEITLDGAKVPLASIVNIVNKQQELVINLSATPNSIKPVLAAINESELNLNPQQDGTVIYLRMPKLTTEHRQSLAKGVKSLGTKVKDKIKDRNFQKRFEIKSVDKKKLSQDLLSDVAANLNYYVKQKSMEIDEIVAQKIDSLLYQN